MDTTGPSTEYGVSTGPIRPGRPRGRAFLLGCLTAIIVIFVLIVGGFLAFRAWIRTPGPLLEGGRLADGSTALYIELRLRKEDPGVRDLLLAAIAAQHQRDALGRSDVPAPVQWILGNIPQRQPSDKEIDRILPVTLAVTRQENQAGSIDPFLFAASMPNAGNTLRLVDGGMSFMMGWRKSNARREQQGNEVLYHLPGEPTALWTSIVGTDILFSLDEAPVRSGIDRLARTAQGGSFPPAAAILSARPADAILFMASRAGRGDLLIEVLETVVPAFGAAVRPLAKDAGEITLWGRLASRDLLEGEMRIREKPGTSAAANPPEYSGTVTVPLAAGNVTIALAPIPKQPGERCAFGMKMSGIEAAARSGLIEISRAERHRRRHDTETPPEVPQPPQPPAPAAPGAD